MDNNEFNWNAYSISISFGRQIMTKIIDDSRMNQKWDMVVEASALTYRNKYLSLLIDQAIPEEINNGVVHAVKANNLKALKIFVESNCNLNMEVISDFSLCRLAIRYGSTEALELLLKLGANINEMQDILR